MGVPPPPQSGSPSASQPPSRRASGPRTIVRALVADPKHGPLPALLLLLTAVTGIVDAVSILALGRVFVANMTGNVVFVGFALAGAPGFSLAASLSALGGFLVGAGGAGRLVDACPSRPMLLRAGLGVEFVMLAAALVVSTLTGGHAGGPRDVMAALAAVAMGTQNAVVRSLKVPDLTTTVLTLTLTGMVADARSEPVATTARRALAVALMLGGAVLGAVLVLHGGRSTALAVAVGLVAVTWLGETVLRRARPYS